VLLLTQVTGYMSCLCETRFCHTKWSSFNSPATPECWAHPSADQYYVGQNGSVVSTPSHHAGEWTLPPFRKQYSNYLMCCMAQFSICNSYSTITLCSEIKQTEGCEKFRYSRIYEVKIAHPLPPFQQTKIKCSKIHVQQKETGHDSKKSFVDWRLTMKECNPRRLFLFPAALCSQQCFRNLCEQNYWHCVVVSGGCFGSSKALPWFERLQCNYNIIAFCQFSFAWTTWLVTL